MVHGEVRQESGCSEPSLSLNYGQPVALLVHFQPQCTSNCIPEDFFNQPEVTFGGLFPLLSLYAHLQVWTNKEAYILQHAFIKEDILMFAFHLGLV